MKLVKPITIDSDSVLISSNIAEPDLSTGEVEWVDGAQVETISTSGVGPSYPYDACLASVDGYIYAAGGGDVIKINPNDDSIEVVGTTTPTTARDIIDGGNGSIYIMVGTEVYELSEGSLSSLGFASDCKTMCLGGNGVIYFFGGDENTSASVKSLDTDTGVISAESLNWDGAYSSIQAPDGNIYVSGDNGSIYLFNVSDISRTEISTGSYEIQSLAYGGSSASIYGVGSDTKVLNISTESETATEFGLHSRLYNALSLSSNGNLYAFGASGYYLLIDEAYQTVTVNDEDSIPGVNCACIGLDGFIYLFSDANIIKKFKPAYIEGDQVIKTSTHKIYQATTTTTDDPEIGVNLAVPSWIEVSATNKYKPFDDVVGTQVESDTGTISYEILPGEIVGGIAGLNLENATSVNVVMNDPTYGEVYNNTLVLLDESNVVDAYSYWWSDFKYKTVFTMLDLPSFKNATITVTITGSGTVKAGVIIVGPSFDLGTTLHGTNTKLLDYSTYNEDSFGNITVTKRVPAKLVNFIVSVQSKDDLDDVYEILESMVGEYGLYIGEEDNAKEMTTAFGLHRNITLSKDEPTLNKYTLQIRGLT